MKIVFSYRKKTPGRAAERLNRIVEINEAMEELCRLSNKLEIKYSDFIPALKLL